MPEEIVNGAAGPLLVNGHVGRLLLRRLVVALRLDEER